MSTQNSVPKKQLQEFSIVYYDGDCGFCSWSVQTVHKLDKGKQIHFAALQGETAKLLLPETDRIELSTLVFQRRDKTALKRSTAVIEILRQIGGFLGFMAPIGYIIPRPWRDSLYDFVAKRRKKILTTEACALPTPSLRAKMLP